MVKSAVFFQKNRDVAKRFAIDRPFQARGRRLPKSRRMV